MVFGANAGQYAMAGWSCILPVPTADKHPPPVGFTGGEGRDTTPPLLIEWAQTHAEHSVALRMPDGVVGIDVDHYDKGGVAKRGADTLAVYEEKWGPLPPTWSSTARGTEDGPGPSRIMFYRVPAQRYTTKLGADVEIIQRHHRYAVVAPSPNQQAGGATYRWYDPQGRLATERVPGPTELAELPPAWVEGLAAGATEAGPAAAAAEAGEQLLSALMLDDRPECADMYNARLVADEAIRRSDEGGRHDTMTERVYHIVRLAAGGHPGAAGALEALRAAWEASTAGEDRGAEFERDLLGAARKAVTALGGTRPVAADPCAMLRSSYVSAPAPIDDRPRPDDESGLGGDGETPLPGPVEPTVSWSPYEFVGVEAFDPVHLLDQPLAEDVLARVYPAMRYAYDAGSWLVREPLVWRVQQGNLAGNAVALVAPLMPQGDPSAEKDSDAYARYVRRKRFNSNAPRRAIATTMHDLIVGGTHPFGLQLAYLDTDPEVLWAGGVPWDLRRSVGGLTVSALDPGEPHLQSAAVLPVERETPLWDAFLAAVWPDEELRAWAVRVLSIAVTGHADRALPILLGETGRGKTQVVNLMMSVLGTYAHAADPRLLGGADSAHASIVYALKGRRLSFIDEGPREGRWAQERLKQLTGGAELTGNQMRENPVTFPPTHTLVLTANEEPNLTDPAVRSRVRLIPCDGDPEQVARARAALGHVRGLTWRTEAPGVLAALIKEAAAWLADPESASVLAGPERVRFLAEEIGTAQEPVRLWVEEATEPWPQGTPAGQLYKEFVTHCKELGLDRSNRIPSMQKWGRELTRLGYLPTPTRDGKLRPLRVRPRGGWSPASPAGPVTDMGSGVTDRDRYESTSVTPSDLQKQGDVTDVTDVLRPVSHISTPTPIQKHVGETEVSRNRSHEDPNLGPDLRKQSDPYRSQISGSVTPQKNVSESPDSDSASTCRKAEKKAERKRAKIAAAAGQAVPLPAMVTRSGQRSTSVAGARATLESLVRAGQPVTVDVEHSGYPIGHPDYQLRTVQLGDSEVAIVLDAGDDEQGQLARDILATASVLHAHSATADIVPLVRADLVEVSSAWARMYDTVIPAKLADPSTLESDESGLKELARSVLGDQAVSPPADEARAALFKAGGWLVNTKTDTPVARSGWTQVDHATETMTRYDGSDVLDTALLAVRLPWPAPELMERERTAQRMTARVTHDGLRIDGDHVTELLEAHTTAREAAGERVRAFGVDNPGSNQQLAARLVELGVPLPRTAATAKFPQGQPSVAAGVLEPIQELPGDAGELIRATLEFRHHDTAVGTFLEPYDLLVRRGDGRARPTVYTLGADTGRMSCARPNLQQVPREGGYRACFTADEGELLVSADFASVEIRVAAALSGDTNLRRMLAEGTDLHGQVARQVWGPDATKAHRYVAKRIVFGRFYGGGVETLAKQAGVGQDTVQAAIDALDAIAPELTRWSWRLRESVKAGWTQWPAYSGRIIHFPKAWPHKAPNYAIQGTARELLVDTLVRWQHTPWGGCRLLPVHDELVVAVPADQAEEATAALVEAMTSELNGIHIAAEASEPSFHWKDSV